MLLLGIKLNQANLATVEKLKRFDLRISQVASTLNDMNYWYRITDHNIEVLSTYLSAEDYFDELSDRYDNLLDARYHRSHLLRFISLHELHEAIYNISEKLGANLLIIPTPQDQLQLEVGNNAIDVYGYLDIIGRTSYELIHVTPIPQLTNETYLLIADPEFSTFAINLNH